MTDFAKIYQHYFQDVYRFLLRLSQDEAMAEELTQQCFFQALERLNTFRGDCELRVWLCQIAKNLYFSHRRQEKRLARNVSPTALAGTSTDQGLEYVLRQERSQQLHQALHQLTEPYKEVFSLRVFGELSYAQISSLFGKTESWARVTFHRAKLQLQQRCQEE